MAEREQRIEMLSPEDSLEVAKSLHMHESIARLNIFRVLLHRPKTAKAISDLLETGDLADPTWRACFRALGRDAAIDMVTAIGTWLLISKVARGLRIPLEEGVEGWPPDGRVPPSAQGIRG